MIIDSVDNAYKYYAVNPLFEKAFAYIGSADLAGVEPGKYDIDGDRIRAIFSDKIITQKFIKL